MYVDEVQGEIDLTPSQRKAWTLLVKAVNKCRKENIYFYQVLDNLGGLNGNNVERVDSIEETEHEDGGPRDLNVSLVYPTVKTDVSWADDTHAVGLKSDK